MTGRTVVVTGGAGFIGSHLVDSLLADDLRVVVVDDLSSGKAERVAPAAELEQVDISDSRRARRRARRRAPRGDLPPRGPGERDGVGQRSGTRLRVNVQGTLNVLEAATRHRRADRLQLDRRRAVRRRRADPDGRGSDPRPARALRRLEVGRRGVRDDLGGLVAAAPRDLPARQRLRPAPEPARRGRRGRDLQPPPLERHAARRCSATARRRATTCTSPTSSAACARRAARAASSTSRPASRPTCCPCSRACSAPPGQRSSPCSAPLREGELLRSCLRSTGRAGRCSGSQAEVALDEGLRSTYEALVEEFKAR